MAPAGVREEMAEALMGNQNNENSGDQPNRWVEWWAAYFYGPVDQREDLYQQAISRDDSPIPRRKLTPPLDQRPSDAWSYMAEREFNRIYNDTGFNPLGFIERAKNGQQDERSE